MHFVKVKGILSSKNGMNIYRGCSHGCIYCDSRSNCYQINHEFEDIEVKENAIELLESKLLSKRKKCMISTGSMCDPYMHIERQLEMTKKALEVIYKHGFGATVITKSDMVLRDLDLFKKINKRAKAVVQMTLTTYDDDLCKILEPHVSSTSERFKALEIFRDNNIPTVVWFSPLLPFINDTMENVKGIMDYCVKAKVKGIICFGIGLTLREGNREYFYKQLEKYFPGIKEKYMKNYGLSYEIGSPRSNELWDYIKNICEENNIMINPDEVFKYLNYLPDKNEQLTLF